jgi:hypothetical protein
VLVVVDEHSTDSEACEGWEAGGGGRMNYAEFLRCKTQDSSALGFAPVFMPDFLFDFQAFLTGWGIRKGRAAYFADCGMGKTPMELVWGQNVVMKTNRPVLHLTPLAVSAQTVREGEKFGIEAKRSLDGKVWPATINVTNYERLHYFNADDFAGVVCDESSILKSFDGARRSEITEFMRKMPYRLLGTATAAPNDYIELGTSSEALGELGHMDMLQRFFKNDQNTCKPMVYRNKGQNFQQLDDRAKWRFKGHAEIPFWRWMTSWARACRKPSDVGFDDGAFILPPLIEQQYVVESRSLAPGMLFPMPAVSLPEQREERRRTIQERCEKVAELVDDDEQALIWCHLNDEGNLLEELIPDAVQISGEDEDEEKEEKFLDFANGKIKDLVTKPKIGAWGLNFQNCAHITSFPSHSFEQYYQAVRRCWRFGQKRTVRSDIVTTEGERDVMANLQRKAKAADRMFSALVEQMNYSMKVERSSAFTMEQEIPAWL